MNPPLTPAELAYRALLANPRALREAAAEARDAWARRRGFADYAACVEAHRRKQDCLDR